MRPAAAFKSVVVEKGVLGGQVALTPVVENYPGMKEVGGKTLVDIMVTHALEYVQIFPGEEVIDITPGEPHIVQTSSRRKFKAQAVLLATGASHRNLGVPGEEQVLRPWGQLLRDLRRAFVPGQKGISGRRRQQRSNRSTVPAQYRCGRHPDPPPGPP
jgi:predicted flavoprotein YhiN